MTLMPKVFRLLSQNKKHLTDGRTMEYKINNPKQLKFQCKIRPPLHRFLLIILVHTVQISRNMQNPPNIRGIHSQHRGKNLYKKND